MPTYLSLSFKSLASSAWRWVFTLIAVALGVGGIVACLSINQALTDALNATAHAILGRADAQVLSLEEGGFSEDAVAAIAGRPQVGMAVPRMTTVAAYQGKEARGFARVTGIDPKLDPELHPMPLLAGQPLSAGAPDDVLLPQTWAQEMKLSVGDTLEVMTGERFETFRVRGLVGGVPDLVLGDAPYMFLSLDSMRAHFAAVGARVSEVSVRYSAQGASAGLGGLLASLDSATVEPHVVRDLQETEAALAGDQRDFRWLLALFGAVILAGSGTQILNTLTILSYQRGRELALLRTAGATRRQVVAVIMLEVLLVGFVGSLIGIALGALLTGTLSNLVQAGRGLQLTNVGLRPVPAIMGLVSGLLVSLLAALIPAIAASRREPLDAMRAVEPDRPRRLIRELVFGTAMFLALAGLVGTITSAGHQAAGWLLLLGFAGTLLLALLLLLVAIVPLLIRLSGWTLRHFPQRLTYIVQRSLIWRTNRTAATVSALSVAVALLAALLTLAGSALSVGRNTVGSLFPAPYVLVAPGPVLPNIIPEIEQASGASATSPLRWVTLRWDDRYVQAVALDPEFYAADGQALPLVQGDRATALASLQAEDSLLVSNELAQRQHLQLGSLVNIWTPDAGTRPMKVAGLLQRSFPGQDPAGTLVISQRALKSYFHVDSFTQLLVRPSNDNPGGFEARLRAAADQYGLQVRSSRELSDSIDRALRDTLWLFIALTATAALVGGMSIINTMNLNVLERVRAIDLLRSAGMTTRQVAEMVLIEGLLLGILSGVLGVALGLGLGWLLFGAGRISQDAIFAPPLWVLVLIPASGLLTFLAAIYPARVAAASSVLGTIRSHLS